MTERLIVFLADKMHIVIAGIAVVYFIFTSIKNKITLAVYGAFTLPVAYVLGKALSVLIHTQRPFVTLGVTPLVAHVADNGFPSEHTLYALIIAGVIYMVQKQLGLLLIALALLVGVGRVFALVHNPIDIIGSAVLAFVVLYLLTLPPARSLRTCIEQFILQKIAK